MATNTLECVICCNVFSKDNSPRILSCSHAFCSPCINRIIEAQAKTCPSCGVEFTATSAEDLTLSNEILDEMKGVFTATNTLNEMRDEVLDTRKEIRRFKEMLTDIELCIDRVLGSC